MNLSLNAEIESKSILIVDDNKQLLRGVSSYLDDCGFLNVTTVSNGAEAIERCIGYPPDLILVDIEMPGISGWDVLSKLRAIGINSIAIVLSAHDKAEFGLRAAQNGAFDFIAKSEIYETSLPKVVNALRFGHSLAKLGNQDLLLARLIALRDTLAADPAKNNDGSIKVLENLESALKNNNLPRSVAKKELSAIESALAGAAGNVIANSLIQASLALARFLPN